MKRNAFLIMDRLAVLADEVAAFDARGGGLRIILKGGEVLEVPLEEGKTAQETVKAYIGWVQMATEG